MKILMKIPGDHTKYAFHNNTLYRIMKDAIHISLLSYVFILASNVFLSHISSVNSTLTGANSGPDRVHVIRQPPANNPVSYKQTKQPFKENFEKLVIHVKENTPIGTKLTDVQPRDADSGSIIGGSSQHLQAQQSTNDKAIYAIVGGADQQSFTLRIDERENKVELVNEVNFDYESPKKNYHVIIRATSLCLRYELEVDILVEDENDNKPQLEDFAIVFNNYKNNFPTGPIGRVPATDLDINDALRYRVLQGNNAQLIIVNETNGDIQLSPWLNSNVPLRAVMDVAVSDGINEAVAKLVLTVNLVTESMLHNSVVLRLDNISRDDFLTRKYDIFLNQMARMLGTSNTYSTKDIVVFDIEEGRYNNTGSNDGSLSAGSAAEVPQNLASINYKPYPLITNASSTYLSISFSARAQGTDVEAYMNRQYIEERIFLNRIALSQNLDAQVAPFQDDICVTEPCLNYQECQITYKFDRAPKTFYTNRSIIFRFIKTSQSYSCLCPATFTGMKNKNECNLQINQCFSNPCLNGGICHRSELGYTCECRAEFFGPKCEHSFTNSTCHSIGSKTNMIMTTTTGSSDVVRIEIANPDTVKDALGTGCSGMSRCVNLSKSHQHYYHKSGSTSVSSASSSLSGGFVCQGCPYASQWSTDLCQLRTRSFDKNSYLLLPSLRRRHQFNIQLKFTTIQSDAILFYNGRFNDKRDYIALEIVDSRLKFSYSLGTNTFTISLPAVSVADGQWHKATIDYRDRNVTLTVDECDPVIDDALSKMSPSSTPRCSNTSHAATGGSEQMLDLTSPMQIGAIPLMTISSLGVESDVGHHLSSLVANSFIGCLGDLLIDHQLIDLSSPLQDSGTQAGCPEKRNYCQQQSCSGFPCREFHQSAKCQCSEDRIGKSCELSISQEKVRKFSGNSYITFNPIEAQIPSIWRVSLFFRTINPNGILFKIALDTETAIILELYDGGLKLSHRSRSITLNKIQLDDGEWHHAGIVWSQDGLTLQLDHNPTISASSTELGQVMGSTMRSVIVGSSSTRYSPHPSGSSSSIAHLPGQQESPPLTEQSSAEFAATTGAPIAIPTDEYSIYQMYGSNNSLSQSFVGCIYALNISDNTDWWQSPNDERNVERGCPTVDVCETNQCPPNSSCVRKGMNQRKCVCNPGFVGDQCIPVCDLNPCQGANSKCIPINLIKNSSENANGFKMSDSKFNQNQYICECEQLRSGKNCEHQLSSRCPSNWWDRPVSPDLSSPICGPCNCDETKGLDGDCDKTTGKCFCKANHYQPPGSDFCLDCDCYTVGSLTTSCNQTTGQCKCRPGVVGRRCDTCTSPYAEVTRRGCEVIYDACPKTFSDGIWWDKTQLDRLAIQQCPHSTSSGTASRFCHKTEGWQKANLFDCISNTFTDLYTQYRFLEENKFQMTANLAIKIANNLRIALNETISSPSMQLYGSDMFISFRLLHHLIQHESHQTGLNLTHRQDRLYIKNIAESISYILDPVYADNWPVIAARSQVDGGAEHLLRLMDIYGKVLIESQSDTFTQPFEVSTKNFQFGMDNFSIDQLYDMSKWTFSPNGIVAHSHGSMALVPTPGSASSYFPPSPPYATDPFEAIVGGDQLLTSDTNRGRYGELTLSNGHFNADGTSVNLDYTTMKRDASPSVIIPKYDNYPPPSSEIGNYDQAARALIPLKTLRMKIPVETALSSSFFSNAKTRTERQDPMMPDHSDLRVQKPAVVYSIFKTLGPLLPKYYDNSVQNRLGVLATANSPVIWLTVRAQNSSEYLGKNIQPKITYILKMLEPIGKTRPQCAIWDFLSSTSQQSSIPSSILSTKNNSTSAVASSSFGTYSVKQTGRFTTRGCEIKGVHPNHRLRYKYDYVNCSCDHSGAVIVLMDSTTNGGYDYLSNDDMLNLKETTLQLALCASLLILLSTLFVLSCIRGHSIKSNSNSINKNLIVVLMVIELLILYTVMSRGSLNQREYHCKLVAIFLHYFSISLFFWLLVNAIHFYRMLSELRDINHGPMKFYHVLGYAVPAFFVSIAVGLRIEQFGNYLFCWLSIHEPIIWSMFGPICLVSMLTIILFKIALCKSLPLDKANDDPNGLDLIKTHMLINIIKTPVIGIYWLIAVYAVNEALDNFAYLFPVVTVLKSITLLVILCIVDRYVRYNMYICWLRLKGEKVSFYDDSSGVDFAQYGGVVNPLNGQQWIPAAMNPIPGGDYGTRHLNNLDKNQSSQMIYPGQPMTPGFQSSCADIFRPELLQGLSAASTTSQSTATGTQSSMPYKDYSRHAVQDESLHDGTDGYDRSRRHRRRHGKKYRKHHHHSHRRHHHHHHHHRSHHSTEYNVSRDNEDDASDYGRHSHHHHHHHHEHRRHHSHRNKSDGGHYGRAGPSRREGSTRNDDSSLETILKDEKLASSHSSDDDDTSTAVTKKNNEHEGDVQQQTVPMELNDKSTSSEKLDLTDARQDEQK